jgi:uncharacterized alpha/beta hydrolase family protein
MLTLNQKELKKVLTLTALAGRLDELNRLEGYVPSAVISRRKSLLKSQVKELTNEKKKEEETVHIQINVTGEEPKVEKKEKSFSLNLKNILSGNFKEVKEEEDDDILVTIKNLLPAEQQTVIGKIVREL